MEMTPGKTTSNARRQEMTPGKTTMATVAALKAAATGHVNDTGENDEQCPSPGNDTGKNDGQCPPLRKTCRFNTLKHSFNVFFCARGLTEPAFMYTMMQKYPKTNPGR